MREIKFRVRCKKTKIVVYCDSEGVLLIPDTGQLYGDGGLNVTDYYYLEQYTGLKDMSGTEIYEGDKIRSHNDYYGEEGPQYLDLVCYFSAEDGHYRFKSVDNEYDDFNWYNVGAEKAKVIGNIYENPELVRKQETSDS